MIRFPTRHGKKLMYLTLLLLFAALFVFQRELTDFHHVVGAKSSVDRDIRNGNFIASRPVAAERGGIAFFEREGMIFVRRLLALPGDVISADDKGIFVDGKPLDTRFLAKGAHVVPDLADYRVPPNRVILGSGATGGGAFSLMEIDLPAELRLGEVAFTSGHMSRATLFGVMLGAGYLFLLVFGPLIAERWLDPQERWYRPFKVVWFGIWLLALTVLLFYSPDWDLPLWQRALVTLAVLNVRFTSLLVFFGVSLKQSAIVGLVTAISGLLSAGEWARKAMRWSRATAGPMGA